MSPPHRRLLGLLALHLGLLVLLVLSGWADRYRIVLEVRRGTVTAFLDGREAGSVEHPDARSGGLALVITPQRSSLAWLHRVMPRQSWRNVRITDLEGRRLLAQARRPARAPPGWTVQRSRPDLDLDGRPMEGTLSMTPDGVWKNYRLEAELHRGWSGRISVLMNGERDRVDLRFTRIRHHGGNLVVVEKGRQTRRVRLKLRLSQWSRAALLLRRLLDFYFAGVLLAVVAGGIAGGVLHLGARRPGTAGLARRLSSSRPIRLLATALPWGVAGAATAISSWICLRLLGGIPHVQDSVCYLFQARLMAAGRLWAEAPQPEAAFWLKYMVLYQGKLFAQYGFGWPLVLALGVRAGLPWLVNPLLGGLGLLGISRLGSELYDGETGRVAALLGLVSPFYLLMSGSFMSHSLGLVAMTGGLYWTLTGHRGRRLLRGLGAGGALSLLAATRVMSATVLFGLMAILLAVDLIRSRGRSWPHLLGVVIAGLIGLAALLGYNAVLTGDPLVTGYDLALGKDVLGNLIGFDGMYSPLRTWNNVDILWSHLMMALLRWPAPLVLAPLMIPLLLGRGSRGDKLLYFGLIGVAGIYFPYYNAGICYGPRYYFEALPMLLLLTARGIRLPLDGAGRWLARSGGTRADRVEALLPLVRWAVVGAVLLASVVPLSGYGPVFRDLRYRNVLSPAILRSVAEAGLENALVFVDGEPLGVRWLPIGSVYAENAPDFQGPVVYAGSRGWDKDREVMERYPGRDCYQASYPEGELTPYRSPEEDRFSREAGKGDRSERRSERRKARRGERMGG